MSKTIEQVGLDWEIGGVGNVCIFTLGYKDKKGRNVRWYVTGQDGVYRTYLSDSTVVLHEYFEPIDKLQKAIEGILGIMKNDIKLKH